MRLVHKDGIMVMDVDESADDDLIAMLKAQGWSEPSYYCKNCGEVPMSKGLCSCFGKGGAMKYSIGDRVIVKEGGEKGIVVDIENDIPSFAVYVLCAEEIRWHSTGYLLTDLTAIEKPFGLLSKEVQDELKAVNNYQNIQYFSGVYNDWRKAPNALWSPETLYRLDPNWKAEEVKEMTVADVEKLVGGKVKIVKER